MSVVPNFLPLSFLTKKDYFDGNDTQINSRIGTFAAREDVLLVSCEASSHPSNSHLID